MGMDEGDAGMIGNVAEMRVIVGKRANEARADPAREAVTVVIGIHPFVIGTPDGAAALRRVLVRLQKDDAVWLTDTDAILKAAMP